MSHRGSILCLPSGIHAWEPAHPLDAALVGAGPGGERQRSGFLFSAPAAARNCLLPELRRAFAEAGIALEAMDTGAACRTYNMLLAEGRPVGAALIAVD